MTTEKIMEKIKKLLALANNNPSEDEAMAAALKAQEMMAKYNIVLDDLDDKPENHEIVKKIWVQDGKHNVKKWKWNLAQIVAKNFRCKVYAISKTDICFYGYKEDAEIALQVFSFLYNVGNKFAIRHYNKCKKENLPTKGVMNTYLAGFRQGIADVLEKQCVALMIVTPKDVEENFSKISFNGQVNASVRCYGTTADFNAGRTDGKSVAQSRYIEA